ncbi:methyl-accepting chemotaxis protein [Treponema bryantii]|uniref:Methyl-accepting chemotaxis protein n=1 Tax=Treponema bryantii TaxID=163 RepID=A0A1H9C9L7_9SPIR|nr:methyl-accepting chemotaxis protein [Treponema bryantii]SEP97667.1 methyl-accepting chemotaxis protein [Treponema bryantii]
MKQNEKYLSLERRILRASHIPDIACGLVLLLYTVFILNLKFSTHYPLIITVALGVLFAQFVCSTVTNHMFMGKVSKRIEIWENEEMTKEERTKLFLDLHKLPKKKSIETTSYFVVCAIALAAAYHFIYRVNLSINIVSLCSCFLGAYVAGLLALANTRGICNEYACRIVEEGIDEKILNKKSYFGVSYHRTFALYCTIPVVWGIVLAMMLFYVYYYNNVPSASAGFLPADAYGLGLRKVQLSRIGVVLAINTIVGIVSVYSFLNSILISSDKLQNAMLHIIKNDIFTVKLVPTDFESEVSYNLYLINQIVLLFRSILNDVHEIGNTMIEPIEGLTEIAQSTASTSLEQSTGVKEILATMEDTDRQTRNIVEKIADVTTVAEGTENNVDAGFETLQSNLDKMTEITDANVSTISGIRELGEKIGSIWEIVKIINDIADQTRIIAFNAELEASSAGDSGKNFHIVANEVRRLAAGITNSVDQIKDRITEIQHSSDNLIITSESGTEKIREGLELSEKLKEKFNDIQSSSEITVESANQIKEIINQQSTSFDQIVATVRQISSGIENFSNSTGTVNNTAQKLKEAANLLENLHVQIIEE